MCHLDQGERNPTVSPKSCIKQRETPGRLDHIERGRDRYIDRYKDSCIVRDKYKDKKIKNLIKDSSTIILDMTE